MSLLSKLLMLACLFLSFWTMRAFAQTPASTPATGTATYPAKTEGEEAPRPSATGAARVSKDHTSIDFEETLLEGKMKAPAGTFLQGRKDQQKNQMVQLRTNFRRELKRSKGGVRALTD